MLANGIADSLVLLPINKKNKNKKKNIFYGVTSEINSHRMLGNYTY